MNNQVDVTAIASNNFCLKVCTVLFAEYCKNDTEINDFKKGLIHGLNEEMKQALERFDVNNILSRADIIDMFGGVKDVTDVIFDGVIAAKKQMGDI